MSEPRQQLHIASARDLFEALVHPEEGVRYSVLQAIAEHPDQAVAYGPWEGEDLVGRLITLARRDPLPMVRSAMVKVIANFRSRRVLEFLKDRMLATSDVDLVLELEPRFGVEPPAEVREFLLELTADPVDKPAQALVGARLLSRDDGLSPAERVRVALLTDQEYPTPPVDATTLDAWIDGLNGVLGDRARALVETHADAALRLMGHWGRLSDRTRDWLLAWCARTEPVTARAAVASILGGPLSPEVARAALRSARAVGLDPETIAPERIREWIAHPDPGVRAAAVEAGLGGPAHVAATLASPSEARDVRLAALHRCAAHPSEAPADALIALLSDPDWRIRAAAADALAMLGDPIVGRVKDVMLGASEAARAAAARVLVTLRGEEWLEQELTSLEPLCPGS